MCIRWCSVFVYVVNNGEQSMCIISSQGYTICNGFFTMAQYYHKNVQSTVFVMTLQHKQCFGCQAPVSSPKIIISGEYMRPQCLQTCAKFHDLSFPFEEDIALALQPVNPQVYWAVCKFAKYM